MVSLPLLFAVRIASSLLLPVHVHPSLKLLQQQQNIESWFTEERKVELQQMLKPFLSEHLFERFTVHESQQQNKKKKRTSTSSIDLEEEEEEGGFTMQDYEDMDEDEEEGTKDYIAILEFLKDELSTDRTIQIIKGKTLQFSFQFTHTSPHYSMIQRTSTKTKVNTTQDEVISAFFATQQQDTSQKEEQPQEKFSPQYTKYNISKYTLKIYVEDLDSGTSKNIANYFSKK